MFFEEPWFEPKLDYFIVNNLILASVYTSKYYYHLKLDPDDLRTIITQYATEWHSVTQCSTVWHGIALYDTV